MQNFHSVSLTSVLVVSLLLTACGDKPAEQKTTQEVEKSTVTSTATSLANKAVGVKAHPGQVLHDTHCISCHDAKVYTRVERKILDYTQLAAQVKRCDANLGSRLFDEDLAHITDYLNQAYYKYPKQ